MSDARAAGARPNLLLITTDQQRGDCLGVERSAHPVLTPHLDQLAAEGMRFTRAYSDCPVCIPARTSIMTGRCAYTHGVTGNADRPLPEEPRRTLPGRLAAAGYQTHAVGKMHFSPPRRRNGFERMRLLPEDYANWLEGSAYPGGYRGHGLGGNEVYPVLSAVPAEYTATHWIVNESIDFLRQRDPDAPFFMWTSFEAPHPPYEALEQFVRLYERTAIPPPVVGDWASGERVPHPVQHRRWTHKLDRLSPAIIEAARRHYYAQITHVDYELGRLFGELQSQQLWQDTAVIFASDHGELLGDHISFHKSFFYEPSARVPLLLRVPQRHGPPAAAGAVIAEPALLADIYATCLALAGVGSDEPDDGAGKRDGVSLARTPHAPAGRAEGRWVFGFCGAAHGMYMATNGRWKYLYYAWGGAEQLFDLEHDPAECHDLAAAGAPDGDARGALEAGRERLRRAVPRVAVPDGGDARQFHVVDEPLPDEAAARASNPFAWRGPIRYGGHW